MSLFKYELEENQFLSVLEFPFFKAESNIGEIHGNSEIFKRKILLNLFPKISLKVFHNADMDKLVEKKRDSIEIGIETYYFQELKESVFLIVFQNISIIDYFEVVMDICVSNVNNCFILFMSNNENSIWLDKIIDEKIEIGQLSSIMEDKEWLI